MEKSKRILVLGDSGTGKTTFIQTIFDELKAKQYLPTGISKLPKTTIGCQVHVHYLNPLYEELKDCKTDYYLEFHDIAGNALNQPEMFQVYLAQ